jgi:serine/threonine protein kinase
MIKATRVGPRFNLSRQSGRRAREKSLLPRQCLEEETMTVSLDEFVNSLSDSGILSADEVRLFVDRLPKSKRPADAEELARSLVIEERLTPFQADELCQGNAETLLLGDYLILDRIGVGGMGKVFKAVHRRMERLVALKILPPGSLDNPTALERFRREVKAIAMLEHPNIVTAHDAGEADGVHYLVMQYFDSCNLKTIVQDRGRLSTDEAVDYIVQAATGLQYAHSKGVIHRDIKPANLLVDSSGEVKVLDLGLVLLPETENESDAAGSGRLTVQGQVLGTPKYMSPEQAEDTHSTDARSDIYSLGATLFCLLTGSAPYSGETTAHTLLAHLEEPIPSLSEMRSSVPPELDAICRKMLAKRPEDRYQSMGELIAELGAVPVSNDLSSDSDIILNRSSPMSAAASDPTVTISTTSPASDEETITQVPVAAVNEESVLTGVDLPSASEHSAEKISPITRSRTFVIGIAVGTLAVLGFVLWQILG